MKKIIIFVLIIMNLNLFSIDYNLEKGIKLDSVNKSYCITYYFDQTITLKSPYNRGKVIRFSDDEKNLTGLGKFVEIEYELGFEFEGEFMSQGKINLIFANVEKILVNDKSNISQGDEIIKTKKGKTNSLMIFLTSTTDDLMALKMWTKDRKFFYLNIWYWDPSYLFK